MVREGGREGLIYFLLTGVKDTVLGLLSVECLYKSVYSKHRKELTDGPCNLAHSSKFKSHVLLRAGEHSIFSAAWEHRVLEARNTQPWGGGGTEAQPRLLVNSRPGVVAQMLRTPLKCHRLTLGPQMHGVPPKCRHPLSVHLTAGSGSVAPPGSGSCSFFLSLLPLNLSALVAHMFAWRWRGLFFFPRHYK